MPNLQKAKAFARTSNYDNCELLTMKYFTIRHWILIGAVVVLAVLVLALLPGLTDESAIAGADPKNHKQVALGKQVYADQCAACHGVNLEGAPNWRARDEDGYLPAPPHDASGHTWHHSDALLFKVTKEGTQAIAGADYPTRMEGFGEALSDKEIWAVLAFIKSRWPAQLLARQQRLNPPPEN
jgi:mono/diheme cytochrome c family protein